MRRVLLAAGGYNLLWGAAVVLFPSAYFRIVGLDPPDYPQIWQCVGMIVGVYGIGYCIASTAPLRHWPITLVGLLGKVLGPLGFVAAVIQGDLPLLFGITILTNDLIWWGPFAAILYQAFRQSSDHSAGFPLQFAQAIAETRSHRGASLLELSWHNPTLVVFLRHTGCTFCRQAVADLARRRSELEARGIGLALVHMSEPLQATRFFMRYGLDTVHRFSDPTCQLYRAFGLERGNFWQLFGPKVWWRGLVAAVFHGHGFGALAGDGFRLPGVFLLDRGKIVAAYRSATAADRPEFLDVACLSGVDRRPGYLASSAIGSEHLVTPGPLP